MRTSFFLLVLSADFGCAKNDMARQRDREKKLDQAVTRIEELGGTVVCEREFTAVDLSSTQVTEDDLILLRDIPALRMLNLSETSITDQGLHYLERFSKLETLSLRKTHVTDEGVARLKSILPRVEIHTPPPPPDAINPFTGKPGSEGKVPF